MNIAVIGAGKSGSEAALLAKRLGNSVFISEFSNLDNFQEKTLLFKKNKIDYEFGSHNFERILDADLIIVSPGIPPDSDIIQKAEANGKDIISELEFAYRCLNRSTNSNKNPIIAVTGTNGKTTTVSLIKHIFDSCGKKSFLVGNVGTPFSSIVDKVKKDDIIILEVSSYQLDRIVNFHPDIAVVLNITEDHLAYHGTLEEYKKAKWKITQNQNKKNVLFLNQDDSEISKMLNSELRLFQTEAEIGFISCHNNIDNTSISKVGTFVRDGKIYFSQFKDGKTHIEELMQINQLSLPGQHNLFNSMAAAIATRAFEIRNEDIRDALMSFNGVEHRLEEVATINGIRFINDSKATNVNASWYALSSYPNNIIWLAGGRGNNDYSIIDNLVKDKVKTIISFGEESESIFNHFCSLTKCEKLSTLQKAVKQAYFEAEKGDIVLFSPACKSFDMFANFEQRGVVFKKSVYELDE